MKELKKNNSNNDKKHIKSKPSTYKNGSIKVYLAGKITKNGWRHTIVPNLRNHNDEEYDIEINNKFTYVGPYFIGCDHGCFHGESTHGRGNFIDDDSRHSCSDAKWHTSQAIIDLCCQWIDVSNVVFCWLDSASAYGTLAELGYAYAKGKHIYIACDAKINNFSDMWFVLQMADEVIFVDSAKEGWDKFVQRMVNIDIPYDFATRKQVAYLNQKYEFFSNKKFPRILYDQKTIKKYFDELELIKNDEYLRYSIKFKFDKSMTNWWRATKINYSMLKKFISKEIKEEDWNDPDLYDENSKKIKSLSLNLSNKFLSQYSNNTKICINQFSDTENLKNLCKLFKKTII